MLSVVLVHLVLREFPVLCMHIILRKICRLCNLQHHPQARVFLVVVAAFLVVVVVS